MAVVEEDHAVAEPEPPLVAAVGEQHARYVARRAMLSTAFEAAGFRIEHSEASLYHWVTRDEPCWETVARLA